MCQIFVTFIKNAFYNKKIGIYYTNYPSLKYANLFAELHQRRFCVGLFLFFSHNKHNIQQKQLHLNG